MIEATFKLFFLIIMMILLAVAFIYGLLFMFLISHTLKSIFNYFMIKTKTKNTIYEERLVVLNKKEHLKGSNNTVYINLLSTNSGLHIMNSSTPDKHMVTLNDSNDSFELDSEWIYKNYKVGDYVTLLIEIKKDNSERVLSKEVIGDKAEYQL